jgi:hypothetical protein
MDVKGKQKLTIELLTIIQKAYNLEVNSFREKVKMVELICWNMI